MTEGGSFFETRCTVYKPSAPLFKKHILDITLAYKTLSYAIESYTVYNRIVLYRIYWFNQDNDK